MADKKLGSRKATDATNVKKLPQSCNVKKQYRLKCALVDHRDG